MRALPATLALALTAGSAVAAPQLSVTATYEARLLIKVADMRTDQVITPDSYRAGARLTTISALGVIKSTSLLVQADGTVAGGSPTPQIYLQTEKNKRRVVRFATPNPADPLTQLLRAALRPGNGSPCIGTAPIWDGHQRYDLTFTPSGGGSAPFGLQRATTCRLAFHPISGFSSKQEQKSPFLRGDATITFGYEPRAQLWVMTDVAMPTVVGTGHIALTSLQAIGVRPAFALPAASPIRQPRKRR
jgi:hypothetical protein